jgi:hypothetical protein
LKLKEVGFTDVGYFLLATAFLYFNQLLIVFIPFRVYSAFFNDKPDRCYGKVTYQKVLIVRKALLRGLKYLPWKGKCLAQALTGKLLLRKVGLPGTIYLGIKKDTGKLEAHAWLISGHQFVSGKEGHKKFTVVQEIS